MAIYLFLIDVVFWATVLVFCFALFILIYKRNTVDDNFKIVVAVLGISFLIETITIILFKNQTFFGIDNVLLLYNTYYSVVYTLWLILYYRLNSFKIRSVIPLMIIFYFLTLILEGLFFLDLTVMNISAPHIVGSLCLTVAIVFYFIKILQDGSYAKLKDNIYFWISGGLLIYYLGTLPYRVVTNLFTFSWNKVSSEFDYTFFNLSFILILVMYLIFAIGFVRIIKKNET